MPLFFLIIFCTFAAHVFVAQPVEQLTLNQWVRGSNPREDTHLHFGLRISDFFEGGRRNFGLL